jgi:putative endonuclease
MARHNDTGKRGEELARIYLQGRGFVILHQNWRHGHHEIDIIAVKDRMLHFIEVKTRRSIRYGFPESAVHPKKLRRLLQSADAFLRLKAPRRSGQIDVLAIVIDHKAPELLLIEDVFT